jgi:hypothetical protein
LEKHTPVLAAVAEQAKARYAQTSEAGKRTQNALGEVQQLQALGDTVTPENVIQGAGKLVAAGESPQQMAALLADMPQGSGEVLQGWLAQHAQQLQAALAQLKPYHKDAAHQLGVNALHGLIAHSMINRGRSQPTATAVAPNLLTGDAGNAS